MAPGGRGRVELDPVAAATPCSSSSWSSSSSTEGRPNAEDKLNGAADGNGAPLAPPPPDSATATLAGVAWESVATEACATAAVGAAGPAARRMNADGGAPLDTAYGLSAFARPPPTRANPDDRAGVAG